jgi:hypothetical protein
MDYTPNTNSTIADQTDQIESIGETDEHEELNRFVENIENLAKEHQKQQLLAIEAAPPIDTQSDVNQQQQQSDQSANDHQTKELNDQQMIQNNFNLFLTASNDNRNDEHMNIDEDLQLNIEEGEFYIITNESNNNDVTNAEKTSSKNTEKAEQQDETNTLSSVSTRPLPSESPLVCDSPIQSYNLRLSNDSHITNDTYSLIE